MERASHFVTTALQISVFFLLVCLKVSSSAYTLQGDDEDEQEIKEILRQSTVRSSERIEILPTFPFQSAAVASFIRNHLKCDGGNVAIMILKPGFRHAVLIANLIGEQLMKHGVPTLGIIKGERAISDSGLSLHFKFPIVIDTTDNSEVLNIFGVSGRAGNVSWLTAWSCDGELRFYYNLYQPQLQLDSVIGKVVSSTLLDPPLHAALRPSNNNNIVTHGYQLDSTLKTLPSAIHSDVIPIRETPETPLTKAVIRVSPRGQWFYFFPQLISNPGGSIYNVQHRTLRRIAVDSVFFRRQSLCSDSIFYLMLSQSYIQVLQYLPGAFDPCYDSLIMLPVSYGTVEESYVKKEGSQDTIITISKANWTEFYDCSSNKVVHRICENDSLNIERFGFTEKLNLMHRTSICTPSLIVGVMYWRSYPTGATLPEVLSPYAINEKNPTTDEFLNNARQWVILDRQTGTCYALGGKLDVNKKLLGLGYSFLPFIASCPDAAIIHEPLTDYITIVPDGISRPIKAYYADELLHPTSQARYPATPSKIYRILAGARAWPKAVGITTTEYALVWTLYEAGRDYEDTRIPLVWQRYDRATGKLIGEWLVPRSHDGLRAQSMAFDGSGNLYVLYQNYRRSQVFKFNNQP